MKSFQFVLLVFGLMLSVQINAMEEIKAPFNIDVKEVSFPDRHFPIEDYGAKEGGSLKCTEAFAAAIEAATNAGGGYVTIPKGIWLTGPIVLKDNVCLQFEEGSEILFSTDTDDYLPAVLSRHQGIDCYKHSAFIYANNATNIGITGKAVFQGQGKSWWAHRKAIPKSADPFVTLMEMAEDGVPLEERIFDDISTTLLAPCFIMPIHCTNVLIEGITLRYGAYWTVNPVYCENVIVRDISVVTIGEYGKTGNGDGINLSSCKNVLVEHCLLNTGDDCITIKSGRGIDGYKKGIPSENIVVRHCESLEGHGGVVIGSETSGGVRNIYIHDCTFNGTDRGLRIKTARGRGDAIENIWFEDITMGKMLNEAIKIHMPRYTKRYPAHPITRMTPRIRNINYKNIDCSNAETCAIRITGLPEMPIEGITMDGIKVRSGEGIRIIDAANMVFRNMDVQTREDTVLYVDNGSNITIESLGNSDQLILIKGEESRGISMINSAVTKANIFYENCKNEVSMLISK